MLLYSNIIADDANMLMRQRMSEHTDPSPKHSIFSLTSQDQDWPPLKQAWQIWSDLRWFPECWRKNFMYQLSASITQPIYPFPPKLLLRILEMVWLPRQWALRGLLWSAPQGCAAKLPLTHSKAFQCLPKNVVFWMKFRMGLWCNFLG